MIGWAKYRLEGWKMRASIGQRLRYAVENFMSKGGKAVFLSLTLLFLLALVLVLVIRLFAMHGGTDAGAALDDTWKVMTQLIDTGTVTAEQESVEKIIGMVATILGVVIFSMLIAFITTRLDLILYNLRRGKSRVLETNHTLILGWSDRVMDILRELIIANESESRAVVVILADADKELMDETIHAQLPDTKTTRVITRTGCPSSLRDLARVNASGARSAIVLATCSEYASDGDKEISDTLSIKIILALQAMWRGEDGFPIIAEIYDAAKRDLVNADESGKVLSIDSWEIMGRLFAQTSLTSGLEVVYNEMLSFDGCEVYFYKADWNGVRFGDLPGHFKDGVPLAIHDPASGAITTKPPRDHVMTDGEEIIILAQDDSSIKFSKKKLYSPKPCPGLGNHQKRNAKRVLILGWHPIGNVVVREYANYLGAGSTVHIVHRSPDQGLEDFVRGGVGEALALSLRTGDPRQLEVLQELKPFEYDTILILSQDAGQFDAEKVDGDTLMILLILRRLAAYSEDGFKTTTILTQVFNSENQELLARTDADDFIISNRLITMMLAQLSEQPGIKRFYDDLFSEEGSEIYVKPATLYFDSFPVTRTFIDLMACADARDEICLGWRIGALRRESTQNFGVTLNPPKTASVTLNADDFLVVLADDAG